MDTEETKKGYFKCNKCGKTERFEKETWCWHCGKGEMVFVGYEDSIRSENKRGEMVPSIPLPFYQGIFKKCDCGKKFLTEKAYRKHYALEHILGLD